ncbi:TPA: hypothetical protein ACK3JH_001276 [Mannheimia haemolytica]
MLNKKSTKKNPRKIIPEQATFDQNVPVYIPLFLADKNAKVQAVWELKLENGDRDTGPVKRNRIQFHGLPVGQHKLTVISGKPLLGQGTIISHCELFIQAK